MLAGRSLMHVLKICNRKLIMAGRVDQVEDGVSTEWRSEGLAARSPRYRASCGNRSRAGIQPFHIQRPRRSRQIHREAAPVGFVRKILRPNRWRLRQAVPRGRQPSLRRHLQ